MDGGINTYGCFNLLLRRVPYYNEGDTFVMFSSSNDNLSIGIVH